MKLSFRCPVTHLLILHLTYMPHAMLVSAQNETYDSSLQHVPEEYYQVFSQEIVSNEESLLSCSFKCAEIGEDCTRFHYQAHYQCCKVTKLKREGSLGATPIKQYFSKKERHEHEVRLKAAGLTVDTWR